MVHKYVGILKFYNKNLKILTWPIKAKMNSGKNEFFNRKILIKKSQFFTHQPPLGGLNDLEFDGINILFILF